MTTHTATDIKRIISGKRPASVVTRETICARRGAVLEDRDTGYLTSHCCSGNDIVAIVTSNTPRVVTVPEQSLKVIFRLQRPVIRSQGMADVA